MVYIRGYLGIELGAEETDWSTKELLTSGFMPSFGLYMVRICSHDIVIYKPQKVFVSMQVVWTYLYNILYV